MNEAHHIGIFLTSSPLAFPIELPEIFLTTFLFFYTIYLLFAGGAYLLVWHLGGERFAHKRIQQKPRAAQVGREFFWSTMSVLIISALLAGTWWLAQFGWIKYYFDIHQHSLVWFISSIGLMAVFHDSYYYWAHRFMHHPRVFRYVHKIHHTFTNPTPFASYAFHPLEAIIEVAWFAPLGMLVPLHPAAMAIYILILTILNVISHLGYEFYSPWVGKWFITSTHHNMHHSRNVAGHFMLYFNLWDKWMDTNAPDYHDQLQRISEASSTSQHTQTFAS